jgi:hypothetical protein
MAAAPFELRCPVAGAPRWGDGAKALVEAVGGRWPADPTLRTQLCHLVWYRCDRDVWEVDDVLRFARLAGAKVTDDQGVQLPFRLGA